MAQKSSPCPSSVKAPPLEECVFRDLYDKETYEFDTPDGWRLVLTRYQARPQPWAQPCDGTYPVLLVHGFSQNRHAWTAGDFVKRLVYRGLDVHILELRGHGKSHRTLQEDASFRFGRPLPSDWNYGWDFSDYFLSDVPAAIDTVKEKTGAQKIVYIGHSMGGIIGYGMAATRQDLLCMMTLGSPIRVGSESRLLTALAQLEPIFPVVQRVGHAIGLGVQGVLGALPGPRGSALHIEAVPMDIILGRLYRSLAIAKNRVPRVLPKALQLFNPGKTRTENVRWVLERGEDREPYRVLRTFARWIRQKELKCPRSLFDFRESFNRIRIPLVVAYGSADILAGEDSTRMAFEKAGSDYLIWKRLEGHGHIDLTVGDCTLELAVELDSLLERAI
jgi:pimeloyl-ACP methyl ester carboxylesterase